MTVGTVTLTAPKRFTNYSETASRTDYVECQPQTVELRFEGGYWLCARFEGTLAASSFTNRTIGEPFTSGAQWSYAGFDPDVLAKHGYDVQLTKGHVETVGTYGPGTSNPGSPIKFFRL